MTDQIKPHLGMQALYDACRGRYNTTVYNTTSRTFERNDLLYEFKPEFKPDLLLSTTKPKFIPDPLLHPPVTDRDHFS